MAKPGDYVRFLNAVGGGRVTRIEGNMAYVEDADGFEVPALVRECVVVGDAPAPEKPANQANQAARRAQEAPAPSSAPLMAPQPKAEPEEEVIHVEETAHGEVLNVVLAFEAADLKQLSKTTYEALLINDSNYYLSFTFSTRSGDDEQWTLRRASVVEPNIELSLGEFAGSDVNEMEQFMLQAVAYKDEKPFTPKPAINVTHKVDTTKFFKLHCFRESIYFDKPVIEFPIVTDDKPYTPLKINNSELENAMRAKTADDRRHPSRRPVTRHTPAPGNKRPEIIEVDLHINELVDNTNGMSRADMLNMQIDEFRRVMDANLRHKGQKIVFIHGKGEGVLRNALLKELNHRYKGHDVCDASFREYGFGATQVTI